jgi:hypothetical protein
MFTTGLMDLFGIRGVDGKIDGNGLGADVAWCNKQAIDQTTLGEPPCNGMILRSGT